MKTLLRHFLINLASLWVTTRVLPAVYFEGGVTTVFTGALVFMLINIILVPLLKLLFLPLNILTIGLFSWVINVLALYALTTLVSGFKITAWQFPGFFSNGLSFSPMVFSAFWVAVIASFVIGFITHFLQWLSH